MRKYDDVSRLAETVRGEFSQQSFGVSKPSLDKTALTLATRETDVESER